MPFRKPADTRLPAGRQPLSGDRTSALERDLSDLLNGLNRAEPASLVVPSEYLEAVINRR